METDTMMPDLSFQEVVTTQIKPYGLTRFTIDNETACRAEFLPSVADYLSAINVYGVILFTLGGVAVLIVLIIYIDTLRYIMKNSPPRVKTYSAFVLGVYPVVTTATYCAIVVPRAHLLAEAATQGIFMVGMYQLFCLLVAYCGGEAELIKKVKPNALDTRVGPCCCWPCCCCLPTFTVNKKNMKCLRLLVLQLPLIQGMVYMALLVMWAERESLYEVNYLYVQPLIIISILSGIWGMSMTIRILREVLKNHAIIAKFFVLQLVLLFAKLQGLATKEVGKSGLLPCKPPLTPMVYANLIQNSLLLVQMITLSLLARYLYKKELPKLVEVRSNNNIEQVCVISTHVSTIENIMKGQTICEPGQKFKLKSTDETYT